MGASDVVPGVSGGTIAFILGIYEELIDSIKTIDLKLIKLLLSFKLKEVFEVVPWRFLLSILFGILLAVFSLARGLEWLLENQPQIVWSFFFGLVLASGITVSKRINRWSRGAVAAAIIAAVAAYFIVGLVPVSTPDALWSIFLSGMIAICAMILPGISGSFILVLLGKYQSILSAVNNRDILTLSVFAAGAAIGIVTFAQIVSWLFKRYHDITVAALMGLMLGSLRKLWPWKVTTSTIIDRHGEIIPLEQVNVLPPHFESVVIIAVGIALVGFFAVIGLDYLAGRRSRAS
ncbi:MAG: DUF368 domain-containing protein [Aliifodinibius sp.]|nr:DUF368 domain-containing protein [Fodinibius sp.]NIV16494.1 DUF368 domain-containing protein [Fodinibius sp.]NIY30451.1 DUF368 domain-containing protein [Fodinibius sp.]